MNRIPWRDNGLLVAAIGAIVFVVLTVTEFTFQEINYQEPVLHFDLQVASETDTEEGGEEVATLSADDAVAARAVLTAIMRKPDQEIDRSWLLQQFPQTSSEVWLDVASSAAKRHYRQSADVIVQYLLELEPESLPNLFQFAKLASDEGADSLAIERYQQLLKFHPNHQASMINLGLLLARENRHAAAIAVQTQAIDISSGERKAKALSIRASSHLELGNLTAAAADFSSSIEFRPTHAPTWRKLANVLLTANSNVDEIAKAFDQAVNLQTDYLQALHERGRFHWLRGEPAMARQDLERVRAVSPDYLIARWTLLHLYIDMGKHRSAAEEIRWLEKQELGAEDTEFIDAIEFWLNQDYAKAQSAFVTLAKEFPNNLWVKYYWAKTEISLKQAATGQVVARLQQLSQDPWMKSLARIALAEAYIQNQQTDEAINVLQQLASTYTQSHSYAYLLGRTYLDLDFYLEAATALQRALKLDQDDSQTRLSLAIAYRRAEQYDLALKTYQELLVLRPNHRAGRYNYALLLDDLDRQDDAIVQYQLALEQDATNLNAMVRLAKLFSDQAQYQQAIALVNEALAERPTYHRARELLVEIYYQQNSLRLALDEVNRLLVLQSNRSSAKALKSDVLRDLDRLSEAAEELLSIPEKDYSRNILVKLFNIGKRALDADDLSLAELCNRQVVERDNSFDKAWVNLSSALNRNGKYAETIALLKDQPQLLESNSKIVINLAQAHHLAGNSQTAIALLEPLQQQDLLGDEGKLVLTASYQAQALSL